MANGQKDESAKTVAKDMLDFINASVTQFHAVGESCHLPVLSKESFEATALMTMARVTAKRHALHENNKLIFLHSQRRLVNC